MKTHHKRVTIYQVAEKAEVAISTVSRVLNDSPNVSELTKKKVQEAIDELNFRPQVSAQHLAGGKPHMLAVAVPSFTTPYYNEVLKGVKDQIQGMDLDIMIYNTGSKDPDKAVENFFDRGTADAIIVISINISENVHQLIQASGIPTVLIGSAHPEYDYFDLNDYKGGYIAAEHLIGQGFKKLGVILPSIETKVATERVKGFRDALIKHDVPIHEKFFITGESTKHAGFTEEGGFEAIYRYQTLGEFPDAIFALNDSEAIGALHALNKIGMQVPDDIAVMGYDNLKLSRYLELTTIDQQMHKVGTMATKRLDELIKNQEQKPRHVKMQPTLIERNSTKKSR